MEAETKQVLQQRVNESQRKDGTLGMDYWGNRRQQLLYLQEQGEISQCMSEDEVEQITQDIQEEFGLEVQENKDGSYTMRAREEICPGTAMESSFRLTKMRQDVDSLSDGTLYRYFGYSTYRSMAQKLLLYLIRQSPRSNWTLLACLPTGGGKSLAWQFPALSNLWPRTIIVVIPTVALSIDHERTSQSIRLPYSEGQRYAAAWPARTGSESNQTKRQRIRADFRAGKLSILYVAPEALLQESFKQMVLQGAKKGLVSAFIVDEAHLLVSWGQSFRVEYQLVPVFCRMLCEACPIGLPVLLLSATLNEADTKTLETLFTMDGVPFCQVRGDKLRDEIEYHPVICHCQKWEYPDKNGLRPCADRNQKILQLLAQVPRPVILYVQRPESAKKLAEKIRKAGYQRVRTFDGTTGRSKRSEYLKEWNANHVDIMVATSAFGMGVDKSDVRTIITAYMPANIGDYYQEVGRAGRDGYRALNYWLVSVDEHNRFLDSPIQEKILDWETFWDRFETLCSHKMDLDETYRDTQVMKLNMNSKRQELASMNTGRSNLDWNMTVLLTLQRHHLVEILDFQILRQKRSVNPDGGIYAVTVRFFRPPYDPDFLDSIQRVLREEKERRTENARKIKQLFRDLSGVSRSVKGDRSFTAIMQSYLHAEYPYTDEDICQLYIDKSDEHIEKSFPYDREALHVMASHKEVLLDIDRHTRPEDIIPVLIRNHIDLVIKKNWTAREQQEILKRLKWYDQQSYMLLTLDEIDTISWEKLPVTKVAIIYTEDTASTCYQLAKAMEARGSVVFHVAAEGLIIPYRNRQLSILVKNEKMLKLRDAEVVMDEN